MNKSIFISGLLLTLALGSCYKDKGNYGYKDVNDFEVTVTLRQPTRKLTSTWSTSLAQQQRPSC